MTCTRLSHAEAITLWQARDVSRVQAVLRRLVLLFWGVPVAFYASRGSWYIGVLAGLLQWAAWRCLCWGLRWVRQGVWRGIDVVHAAVLAWWSTRRRTS